jgi:hypothetical protein
MNTPIPKPAALVALEVELMVGRREMRRLVSALGAMNAHDREARTLLTDQMSVLGDELRRMETQIATIERAQAAAWFDTEPA